MDGLCLSQTRGLLALEALRVVLGRIKEPLEQRAGVLKETRGVQVVAFSTARSSALAYYLYLCAN